MARALIWDGETTLGALAADVRQHPLESADDVRAIWRIIDERMPNDAQWQPHAHEVYQAQSAARRWTMMRFIGMVAEEGRTERTREIAAAIMEVTRPLREGG